MELDSHADTCCAGSNCAVVEYTGKVCNVIGFNRDTLNDELKGIPVVLQQLTTLRQGNIHHNPIAIILPWRPPII
jgi:hypothetical protein